MQILLDTNILLRFTDPAHSQHRETAAAVESLRERGHRLVLVPQVLYEFWVVSTRPAESNGLGMTPEEVRQELISYRRIFRLLRDERMVFSFSEQLVTTLGIRGKQAHDARLAAAMMRFAVSHLLTHNTRDFLRYSTLVAVSPADVLAGTALN